MNAHEGAIGALSEIDRLGQAALDAMYAESLVHNPEVLRIIKEADKSGSVEERNESARTVMDRAEAAAGMPIFEYITKTMTLARAKAVQEYLSARRVLTAAGVL